MPEVNIKLLINDEMIGIRKVTKSNDENDNTKYKIWNEMFKNGHLVGHNTFGINRYKLFSEFTLEIS